MRRQILRISILAAVAMSGGCMTVGLDNEFIETVEVYTADGSIESLTETRWTQNAKGGPFTDVERLKQDTMYQYRGADGVAYDIGQGSGAEGVSGSGQVDALSAALKVLSQALSAVLPSASPMPVP